MECPASPGQSADAREQRAASADHGFADADRQAAAIAGLGLPTSAPGLDASEVLSSIARDKKRRSDATRMVLLDSIGSPRVTDVSDATVTAALAAIGIG